MTHTAIHSQLISTTRHARVVLGPPRDQVGTKLGPSRDQVTGEVTGQARQCSEATADAVKHHETKPVPSLRIEDSQ
ncbi:hypothetical protein ACFQDN_14475 [Pseudomonas asuensis]|uniref:hypothetical protein n=1 Tax=Pseudomonas asuensis TaxID=1825787 RepID=UPI00166B626C|nr:hypothetical protein [Pseudomonas asuensis]